MRYSMAHNATSSRSRIGRNFVATSPLTRAPGSVFGTPVTRTSPRVTRVLSTRLSERRGKLRVVTSRGFIPHTILRTRNSMLAGGCTRNCPKHHCCNNYRRISGVRAVTHRHTGDLFNTRCTGMRPRSNTRTGTTICRTLIGPNSAILNLTLSRNNRLARNVGVGFSNHFCRTRTCNIGPRAFHVSPRVVHRHTLRARPTVVVNK